MAPGAAVATEVDAWTGSVLVAVTSGRSTTSSTTLESTTTSSSTLSSSTSSSSRPGTSSTSTTTTLAGGPSFTRDVQPIFTETCATALCHAGAAAAESLDLSPGKARAQLVGVTSIEKPALKRVLARNSARSYLYLKLTDDQRILGAAMPLLGPALSPARLATIRQWILRGAPND